MNTWIRALLAGMLCTLGSMVGGMGIASTIFGKGLLLYFGWALLFAIPFIVLFILMLIWMPYKNKGPGVKVEP
jgi:hypothetical protein